MENEKTIETYLGGSPIKIEATNGATVNVTINILPREPDSLRRFAEKIQQDQVCET